MPPITPPAPPCPKCHHIEIERLPFATDGEPLPVYSCLACGYVWRAPKPTTGK
jgi:hypothetical protein